MNLLLRKFALAIIVIKYLYNNCGKYIYKSSHKNGTFNLIKFKSYEGKQTFSDNAIKQIK